MRVGIVGQVSSVGCSPNYETGMKDLALSRDMVRQAYRWNEVPNVPMCW